MINQMRIEVLRSWGETAHLRTEWNELHEASGCEHPFTTYEWFDCWYSAYCKPEDVTIVLVKEGDTLRAILPGMLICQKIKGIPFNVFSYAGNGHSPRCGIISRKDDIDVIRASISAVWESLHEKIDMAILESIDQASPTYHALTHLDPPFLSLKVEHSFESPAFSLPEGWNAYFKMRSKSFRDRLHNGINRSKRLGQLEYDIVPCINSAERLIERLKLLDSKTWQHENKTGLFSTDENGKFYTDLIKTFGNTGKLVLCFVRLDGKDIAYSLNVICGTIGYILKTGYDPGYQKCSPGLLNWAYLSEWMASKGIIEIDMLGDVDEFKTAWETHRRRHINYWLVNRKSIKGRFLLLEMWTYNFLKKTHFKKIQSRHNKEKIEKLS